MTPAPSSFCFTADTSNAELFSTSCRPDVGCKMFAIFLPDTRRTESGKAELVMSV